MPEVNVVVLFGGKSPEHDISLLSASEIIPNLRGIDGYSFYPVRIGRDGQWTLTEEESPDRIEDGPRVHLQASPNGAVQLIDSESRVTVDCVDLVLPVLHGVSGEDGVIQGYLDELGVPYVGCGVASSACAMDKDLAKRLLRADGFPVAKGLTVYRNEVDLDEIQNVLDLPLFVKPATGGSSIGVSRVDSWADLPGAISNAFNSSRKVLIEPEIVGSEIEVGVLEFADGSVKASMPAELNGTTESEGGFYDFESKYESDAVNASIPANMPSELIEHVQQMAVSVFRSLGCSGLARVDFFVSPEQVVINEVNTMPGFTTKSMFPLVWAASGLSYQQLLETLLRSGLSKASLESASS